MAIAFVVQMVLFGITAVVGTSSNLITIAATIRYKPLSSTLDTTTIGLIIQLCVCDLTACAIAVPIRMWNAARGASWPFNIDAFCWASISLLTAPLQITSMWFVFVLALTRAVAVFLPDKHEQVLRKRWIRWTLFALPWILGYAPFVFGALIPTFSVSPATGSGLCVSTPVAADKIERFKPLAKLLGLALVCAPLAILFSCLLYVALFIKLWYSNRRRRAQTVPQLIISAPLPLATVSHQAHLSLGTTAGGGSTSRRKTRQSTKGTSTGFATQHRRRLRGVKLLALACFVSMCCTYPNIGIVLLHLKAWLASQVPVVNALIEGITVMSFCITPLVYAVSMPDMRVAYVKVIRSMLP